MTEKIPLKPTEAQTKTIDKFKSEQQSRSVFLKAPQKRELVYDVEARTVELAFSSETPYERWFGDEILDHSPGAIDLTRLESGGAVLMDHDLHDQVGVIESVRIDAARVARAVVRFSRSARGEEIFNDVIDGIRTNISVGYFINDMVLERQGEEKDSYRVTKWQPFEVSIVSVPADPTVGVGRSIEGKSQTLDVPDKSVRTETTDEVDSTSDVIPLTPDDGSPQETEVAPSTEARSASENSSLTTHQENQEMTTPTENQTTAQDAVKMERQRVAELTDLGEKFGAPELARTAIAEGASVDTLTRKILEAREYETTPAAGTTDLGLSEADKNRFSFSRLINAQANPNDQAAQRAAKFELEICAEAASKSKKEVKGVLIPAEILQHQRAHVAGTPSAGGDLIATDLLSGSFIDMLRNRLSIMNAGATFLPGLEGNIAIPRQTGGAAAFWLAENGEPSETSATFDQIALTPKTVGAYTEISRKLLQQSSISTEQFVQNELIRVLALEIDRAALAGSGTNNQPLGLLNNNGIGSVEAGPDGGFPTWSNVVDLETAIADENADVENMRYVTNARVRGKLKKTEAFAGTGERVWMSDNTVNGYPTIVSNQVPKNGTKGSGTELSTMLFGNFADLIIGMWGGLDLQVNPYSLDKKGAIRITAFQDVDTVIRHPESFAAMRDIKVK